MRSSATRMATPGLTRLRRQPVSEGAVGKAESEVRDERRITEAAVREVVAHLGGLLQCRVVVVDDLLEQRLTVGLEIAASDSQRIAVFDSSPLLMTSDAPVLASHVGQIVMVVKANKTPQHAVLAALERLDRSKAINLILNQAAGRHSVLGYGAYYGHGEYGA